MARKTKIVESEGKKFKIEEIAPLDARIIMELFADKDNREANRRKITEQLFAKISVEISPDNWAALDMPELINSHCSLKTLMYLENEATELTFGFFADGENTKK